MKTLFINQYVKLVYYPEDNILEEIFFPETGNAKFEDLREFWVFIAECFSKYKPKYNLTIAKDFLFLINPQIQEWLDKNVAIEANKCLSKKAIVVSSDFTAQVSVEFLMEESNAGEINTKYFETREKALDWLLNKK